MPQQNSNVEQGDNSLPRADHVIPPKPERSSLSKTAAKRGMTRLFDEFRNSWQGISRPSLLFSAGFSVACIAVSTAARWFLSTLRPDVYFTPYFPAVFFATAIGGYRIGTVT